MIVLSQPYIKGNEWKYIKDCLNTGWVSSAGDYVERFEEVLAGYTDTKYAVATVNGTSALHASLLGCDIQPKDEVIVPTLTFIAPVNTVKYCGAEPVFMDCDSKALCISIEKTLSFIKNNTIKKKDGFTYNKKSKRRIKAIIPVHVFGQPVEMEHLLRISAEHNIDIIEDAADSLGSEYKSKKTGSFGKTGCFSFNGNKIITTGGGGVVVTNDKKLADRIRHITTQAKKNSLEYEHDKIGYNYRLTNIQAAMGVAQMEKINEYISLKRKNARVYKELLSEVDNVEFLWEQPWSRSNFWFYTIRVSKEHKGSLMDYLLANDIQVRPIWKLIHTLPMYNSCQSYFIKNAIEAYQTCISLPCSVNLKKDTIKFVVGIIKKYFTKKKG